MTVSTPAAAIHVANFGVLAAGKTPKPLRLWRARIAARTPLTAALNQPTAA